MDTYYILFLSLLPTYSLLLKYDSFISVIRLWGNIFKGLYLLIVLGSFRNNNILYIMRKL